MPLAEEIGPHRADRLWVMRTRVRHRRAVERHGLTDAVGEPVGAQFHDGRLVAEIAGILRRHRLCPAQLELEITESTVMKNPDRRRRRHDGRSGASACASRWTISASGTRRSAT